MFISSGGEDVDIFGCHYSATQLCIFNRMSKRQPILGMFKLNSNSSLHPRSPPPTAFHISVGGTFIFPIIQAPDYRIIFDYSLSLSHTSHLSHKEIDFIFKRDLESDHFSSSLLPVAKPPLSCVRTSIIAS